MADDTEHRRYTNGSAVAHPSFGGADRAEAPGQKKILIVIHVVTYNHAKTIRRCLESAVKVQETIQTGTDGLMQALIWVSDNRSADDTAAIVEQNFAQRVELTINPQNLGFSAAHNLAFARAIEAGSGYVLVLNPDLRLEAAALQHLVEALEADRTAGAACPKLIRADQTLEAVVPHRFDSTGMYITPAIRHFDRGSNELDTGQYDRPEYVFGATGACVLFCRDLLLDLAISFKRENGKMINLEVFDNDFFAYREDADLAWRAQRAGWRCRYVPQALGMHVRAVLPSNRSEVGRKINSWSVRNRFLMQWCNFSLVSNFHCLPQAIWRNLLVIGGVIIQERESLPGLFESIRLIPKSLHKRSLVYRRRRVPEARIGRWFRNEPYAEPALVRKPLPGAGFSVLQPDAGANLPAPPIRSITIIIVNYNSGAHLELCLNSLASASKLLAPRLQIEIVVFDNGSIDQSMAGVEKYEAVPGIDIVRAGENTGFGGAINRAAALKPADCFLILNPDIQIQPDQIAILAGALDRYETLGAISPLLISAAEDKRIQRHYIARSFPTVGSLCAELFYLHRIWPGNPWTAAQFLQGDMAVESGLNGEVAESSSAPIVIEQPAAACLMIRGSVLSELNGFDPQFFPAWFEDVDFLKRMHRAGHAAAFHPGAAAEHSGGYSKEVLTRTQFAVIWYRNLGRYISKHFSGTEKFVLQIALRPALIFRSIVALCEAIKSGREGLAVAKTLFFLGLFGTERKSPGSDFTAPPAGVDTFAASSS